MMQPEPPEFKINWVRVYQDKSDPKQKVGCSTIERPTRNYIEAHEKRYKGDGDVGNSCGVILFVPSSLYIRTVKFTLQKIIVCNILLSSGPSIKRNSSWRRNMFPYHSY